jgi:casein kinase II subunit alpha
MLNVKWTSAVDIWSLGATVRPLCLALTYRMHLLSSKQAICYLLRRHIFVPNGLEPDDEHFALAVLMLQNKYFGPFPGNFFQLLDDEGAAVLRYVLKECGEQTDLFSKAAPLDVEDKDFICYLMKPDPRDRPSASEALSHEWLKEV